jgi:acyl dehydratase
MSRAHILWEDIGVGDSCKRRVTFLPQDIDAFSAILGDTESFHVSDESAALTKFGRRIAHGMHVAAWVSATIGTQLPGFGTVYVSQSYRFLRPVYLGDTVEIQIEVLEKLPRRMLRMSTIVMGDEGGPVMDGEAVVQTYQ